MPVALILSRLISPGNGPVASGTVVPEPPAEPGEKSEKPAENSNPIVSVERVTLPAAGPPSESKRLGGPPAVLFVSADGLTAVIAAICLQQLKDKVKIQNHEIRYGSLNPALPVDSKLFIQHARKYLDDIEIKGWKIPTVATDEQIMEAKTNPNYDPQELVSGNSAKWIVAMDTTTKFNLEKKFPGTNIEFAGNITSLWDIKPAIENFAKKIHLIPSA